MNAICEVHKMHFFQLGILGVFFWEIAGDKNGKTMLQVNKKSFYYNAMWFMSRDKTF